MSGCVRFTRGHACLLCCCNRPPHADAPLAHVHARSHPRYRPAPLTVMFGEPLVPPPGEGEEELVDRYCRALLALGDAHGVKLSIVE